MSAHRMPDTEALLANADWVRALAHRLVADAHAADDIAQDAWTSALQHPPRGDASLPGFLRAIVTNLARRKFRDDRHRALRETRAAREESLPSTADVFERLATHKVVVAAVESLDEPYRTAILLRWFDGLAPRTIATELKVPVKTVNTRLHRGLQILRAKLDRELGEERDPLLSALFLVPGNASALPRWMKPTALGKAVLVSTQIKIWAALLIVVLCAVLLWRADPFAGRSSQAESVAADPRLGPGPSSMADGTRPAARELLAATPDQASSSAGLASAVDVLELTGRVVDSSEKPIAGARLEVLERPVITTWLFDPSDRPRDIHVAEGVSDEHGEFSFQLSIGRPYMLRVEAEGFVPRHEGMLRAGEKVVVHLFHPATIRGHVLSKADQVPIPSADVTFMSGMEPWRPITVQADAGGGFIIHDVGPGKRMSLSLTVHAEHWGAARVGLDVLEGETVTRDVELVPGHSVSGTVRDAVSKRGIADATVYVADEGQWPRTRTDSEGRFTLEAIAADKLVYVRVRCAGHPSIQRLVRMDQGSVEGVDFDLAPSRVWRGRIVTSEGTPVADAWVAADSSIFMEDNDPEGVRTLADGTFELTHLRPDIHHLLFAHKEHTGATAVHMPDPAPETSTGELSLGDIVLLRGALLSGVVVDEDGDPIDHVTVQIRSRGRDRFALAQVPAEVDERHVEWREVWSDARGRFAFADLGPGTCHVTFDKTGIAWMPEQDLELAEGETRRDWRIVVAAKLAIEGRVVDAAGKPCPRADVHVEHEQDGETVGWGHTDDEGRFRIAGLRPGQFRVSASPEYDDDGSFRTISGHVSGVATGTRDLVVVVPRSAWIEGTVVDASGVLVPHALVHGHDERGVALGTTFADDQGRFRYKVAVDTQMDLSVTWTRLDEKTGFNWLTMEDEDPRTRIRGVPAGKRDLVLKLGPRP